MRAARKSRLLPAGMQRPTNDVLRTNLTWEATRSLLIEYFSTLHCLRFRGIAHLPQKGPVILAPNHVSYYDPPLIAAGVPYRVRFMAWDALFRVPLLRTMIRGYGAFPVRLKSADKSAIGETLRLLRSGQCVMIFPEGERTQDGKLAGFESGVARLALQTGATVVPVSVVGGYEAWPRHRLVPRWFVPIVVKFHAPIHVEPPADRQQLKEQIALLNERIGAPIRRRLAAEQRLRAMRRKNKLAAKAG